jgi:hypothetical protein
LRFKELLLGNRPRNEGSKITSDGLRYQSKEGGSLLSESSPIGLLKSTFAVIS